MITNYTIIDGWLTTSKWLLVLSQTSCVMYKYNWMVKITQYNAQYIFEEDVGGV